MTIVELREELKALNITGENFKDALKGWRDLKVADLKEKFGDYKEVYSKGDREGGGEDSEWVVHFLEHDIYLSVTGFYSSYNGTDWDSDITQVAPYEQTIIVYKNV
jgi:hypothetical protein